VKEPDGLLYKSAARFLHIQGHGLQQRWTME
jgi:hypothetical protein